MTELQRIVDALKRSGLNVEAVDDGDGALVRTDNARVALFAEHADEGGILVRLHLDLDLYVDEDALPEVLMGVNLMNQGLDYGSLVLDPVTDEDEEDDVAETLGDDEERVTFAVLGRSVLHLSDLSETEIARLATHLQRFEREIGDTVERTLHGHKSLRA
ncbi:hypothetical protein [Deinococcus maricopensis]|uniref:Sensory transduction regulator n=1 Tax=Deinococcus maricopensis (strain DSM 21211 / LMG 22137 / NRRL B-23946 / LB-34) TaxID=709986 RepID=E8UA59_DEIML|nr:hypothetical protein [Deinococcus maricopensis]ADV67948.1 hypothetical protein Deima_2310 [Deinococcus maricopensis DSM 21211]